MAQPTPGEAAAELEHVLRTLEQVVLLAAAVDQGLAAVNLADGPPQWSPIRSAVELARTRTEAVLSYLRDQSTHRRP